MLVAQVALSTIQPTIHDNYSLCVYVTWNNISDIPAWYSIIKDKLVFRVQDTNYLRNHNIKTLSNI